MARSAAYPEWYGFNLTGPVSINFRRKRIAMKKAEFVSVVALVLVMLLAGGGGRYRLFPVEWG